MTVFWTADNHFGHANIIKHTHRPFDNVWEMDHEMIRRWNEVVGNHDVVYHLGDFSMNGNAREYFAQLNGNIKILALLWHHDRKWLKQATNIISKSFYRVELLQPMHVLNLAGEYIVLSHYPIAIWDRKHFGSWHLHGHSHGNYHGEGKILDVGVDNFNFYPISFEQIKEIMKGK